MSLVHTMFMHKDDKSGLVCPLIKPKKTRKGFFLLEVNFVMSQIEIPLFVV